MKYRLHPLIVFVLVIGILLLFASCSCNHIWTEATCTTPKTCSKCGEIEGEALGHTWTEATCLEPKTCSVCGETDGVALGHQWEESRRICKLCGFDDRPTDDKFIDALARGLTARWKLTNQKSDVAETLKADWEGYFDAEYDEIIDYRNESFENSELGELANQYIDSIIRSKEVLAYYGTNQWDSKYTNGVYNDRVAVLYKIHDICAIPVSDEYQEDLLGVLANGEVINMIRPLLNSVTFELVESSYDWNTYQAVVENTSSLSFSYFCFDIDLIDADGVTLSSESAWVDNWEPGEKIRFQFSTDEVFDRMHIENASWNF